MRLHGQGSKQELYEKLWSKEGQTGHSVRNFDKRT